MGDFVHHGHHECPSPIEYLPESIEERRRQILAIKPKNEHELRLRLLQPVRGELPLAVAKAGAAYDQAEAAYDQAGAALYQAEAAYGQAWAAYGQAEAALYQAEAAYGQAGAAYDQAEAAYGQAGAAYDQAIQELLALHALECPDCPWDPIDQTIFP